MALPRGTDYDQAVQNPHISFVDTELKFAQVETSPLGLPKPYSGGFTTTYKFYKGVNSWAVRCFRRDISDLQQRYQAISNFLSRSHSPYFVSANFQDGGIKVNGKGYPIIKMQWLEGVPLNIYLDTVFLQSAKVEKILNDFRELIKNLESHQIAHGDLQHGNIIVKNDRLFLIDYDGMYLPELAHLSSNEIGHVNYQHPQRSSRNYGSNIDRFSAIAIYVCLKAVSVNPSLWKKYSDSESLIMKSKDYGDLTNSPVIKEMMASPVLKQLVERFVGCCYLDFNQIPTLESFIAGAFSFNQSASGTISITRSQYIILDASKMGAIIEHSGSRVEVVGRISEKHSNFTKAGDPYIFLNFGNYPSQTFTIILWSEGIEALRTSGINPSSLVGKWVSVIGIIGSYLGHPQSVVDFPSQIQVLSSENEAKQRLQLKPTPNVNPIPKTLQPSKRIADKEFDVFNVLYGRRATTPTNVTPKPTTTSKQTTPTTSTKSLSTTITPKRTNTTTNQTTPTTTSKPNLYTNYNPPSTNKPITKSTSSNSNSPDIGCITAIVLGVFVGIIGAVASENFGGFVLGFLMGGLVGNFLYSMFK